ncbi:GNAT family N-acetyltransferase [Adlercreutzia murintestinalis]|uniref:GNAT family N-acetyltransferase n=1 Tax=Adlercreutzia murintestinalis TaxID=2941325 RepID=UPI00203A61A5|nr:GNAT family N-acetyltransferase [Adlercreutzia murintestinalis]
MDTLTVRKATKDDMDAVMDFYTNMIDEMQGTDFDILWKHDEHPSHAFLRESVERGYLTIGIADDGCIACALVIDHTRAPGYEQAPWRIKAPLESIGIVHAVATRPAYHGRGFAKQLLSEAIDAAREEGMKSLQLDTFVENVRSHGLYEGLGFVNHGAWPVFYDDLGTVDLDLFEYVL